MPPKRVGSLATPAGRHALPGRTPTPCGWKRQPVTPSKRSRPRARAAHNRVIRNGVAGTKDERKQQKSGGEAPPPPHRENGISLQNRLFFLKACRCCCFFLICLFFFFSSFGFTTNLRRRDRDFPCTSYLPPREVQFPHCRRPHQSGPLATDEPRGHAVITQSPQLKPGLTLGLVSSVSSDRCLMYPPLQHHGEDFLP